MVARTEVEHRRRQDALAVEFSATAQHFSEAVHVIDSGHAATAGDFAAGCRKQGADGLDRRRRQQRWQIVVGHLHRAQALQEIRAWTEAGVLHADHIEHFFLQHLRIAAALAGRAQAQCSDDRVAEQNGIVHALARL